MLIHLRDYLVGLSVLTALMGLYSMTVATWLKPPEVNLAPVATRVMTDDDDSLVDLFPTEAWQRGRSIRLKTQDGMLLFQHWEQSKADKSGKKEGTKWRLWPITMVIGRGLSSTGSEQPILIEAADGAEIEFDAALDVMSGVAPSIKRGELTGLVHIHRFNPNNDHPIGQTLGNQAQTILAPPRSVYQVQSGNASTDDSVLDIQTANVWIDRRKIWTTEAIHMQVGKALLVGKDLTLHLAASASSNSSSSSSVSSSLDRMELTYLRELTLPLGKDDDSSSTDRGVVEVRCGGPIDYDFALDQLSLHRDVSLLRLPGASPQTNPSRQPKQAKLAEQNWMDRFDCQSLRLTLRDPLNSKRVRESAMDWIDRIEATGSPVRMMMKSQAFDLTAESVLFDPREGWLIAGPAKPTPIANPGAAVNADGSLRASKAATEGVRLRHGDLQAFLSRIVYRFDPKNPEQLGTVEVDSGGRFLHHAADAVVKTFSWEESLRVEPLAAATPDDLGVDFGVWCAGKLQAQLVDGGSFRADRIDGVLKPSAKTGSPFSASQNPKQRGSINQRWLPDRFAAVGNVHVQSQTLHAQTNQLNLEFVHASTPQPLPPSGAADSKTGESTGSIRRWVQQPNRDLNNSTREPVAVQRKPQATIRGDQVAAKLTLGGGELTATDLSVIGNVEVTHPMQFRSTTPGANDRETLLAVLTGDRLRLRDGGGSDVLQLDSTSGKSARLDLGDGYFIGPLIQVRPDDNYVSIPSSGQFVLPTAMLPSLETASPSPRAMGAPHANKQAGTNRWTKSPHCRFGGSMTFDGQTATLAGGVELDAAMVQSGQSSEIRLRGDELKLSLESRVDLQTPATFRATRLAQISLLQTSRVPIDVLVDRFAMDGLRESRHHLQTSQLVWMPAAPAETTPATTTPQSSPPGSTIAGQIIAPGPGSYRAWMRGSPQSQFAGLTNQPKTRTRNPSGVAYSQELIEDNSTVTASSTELTGVHLIYQGEMRGDLFAKSLTFRQGVRVAQQAVRDFDSTFDARTMDQLSNGEMTLDCDQLTVSVDPAKTLNSVTPGAGMTNSVELACAGGVLYRSRTEDGLYEITANQCSYTVAKDLFTIQGVPNRPARFQKTDPLGRPSANLAIRNMTMRLKTMEVLSSQIESFQLGQLPGVQPRK